MAGRPNNRLDNYVYIFLDPRKPGLWEFTWEGEVKTFNFKPFWVGRGVDKRMMDHFQPSSLKEKTYKNNKIKSIMESYGSKPLALKAFENLTYSESVLIESSMIIYFGRAVLGTGILTNVLYGEGCGLDLPIDVKGKISENLKNKFWPRSKRVSQFDLNWNLVKTHDSVTLASREVGADRGPIYDCCLGRRKTPYLDFYWKFDGTSPYIPPVIYDPSSIPVFQYLNGQFVNRWESIIEASRNTNGSDGGISNCLRSLAFSSGGCQWFTEYQGESIPIDFYHGSRWKAVLKLNDNFEIIERFDSLLDASKAMGLKDSRNIRTAIRRNGYSQGFRWKFDAPYLDRKPPSEPHKTKVVQLSNGSFVRSYNSIREAAKETGGSPSAIANCCNGRSKSSGGFQWFYEKDYKP